MFISSNAVTGSVANKVAKQAGAQARIMWFDAEANVWELSTRAGVADMVRKCKSANINTIIVDVKPLAGVVLYNSKIAPKLRRFEGKAYPAKYDLLQTTIEECHKSGIPVYAAINVFSEGSRAIPGGPAHSHEDWQCLQYQVERKLVADDGTEAEIKTANAPFVKGQVCLYGEGSEAAGELPANTVYLRVTADGMIDQCGIASGLAHISAPEGGYLLLGSGKAGSWLKGLAKKQSSLRLEAKDAMVRTAQVGDVHHAIFVNPLHPEVRAYELSIIKEICSNYDVDGIVLDRMRYPNLYTDFSDISRREFEKMIGRSVENWPFDIIKRSPTASDDIIRGPLFKDWLKFRAKVMHDFIVEAREMVKSTKPDARLGIYVGSWYPLYYDVGINWGSPRNTAEYEWWPQGYEQTGYADQVDFMCTGCYYVHPTRKDAIKAGDPEWMSVEASAQESINAVRDDTFVYASLYLMQYQDQPHRFTQAVKQCLKETQGCMLFDLVYVRNYDWWDILKSTFPNPAKAPHEVQGLLERLRTTGQQAKR